MSREPVTGPNAFRERLARSRQSPAYQNYLRARDHVMAMTATASTSTPSAYWREELANFEYMLDASPLVIEKLRHHSFHVTGLRVYDYRSNREQARKRFAKKLRAMRKRIGDTLLVPESRLLGGFGFEIEGQLYNIDTLKFYEVLAALERGAVLGEFRNNQDRRLVWEIGAGWGGFAYQFKTLCPNTTYVIVDLPELFLFSATYLMSAFPKARVAFSSERSNGQLSNRWSEFDFIFVSNADLHALEPPRVDLTINMVSFQEMTTEQVDAYARRAFDLRSPALYSLNRERSSYNRELTSVGEVLERYYWLHETKVMPVGYQKMLDEEPSPTDYRHLIGWRRVKID